jgi:hypothetical protein
MHEATRLLNYVPQFGYQDCQLSERAVGASRKGETGIFEADF